MKLIDLNPRWHASEEGEKAYLEFECPAQHIPTGFEKMKCHIVLPILPTKNGWTWESGESFEDATIRASVWHHCEKDPHFYITNGEIIML